MIVLSDSSEASELLLSVAGPSGVSPDCFTLTPTKRMLSESDSVESAVSTSASTNCC